MKKSKKNIYMHNWYLRNNKKCNKKRLKQGRTEKYKIYKKKYNKEYFKKHPKYQLKWQRKNKLKCRAYQKKQYYKNR
jgi:hypothetical protein